MSAVGVLKHSQVTSSKVWRQTVLRVFFFDSKKTDVSYSLVPCDTEVQVSSTQTSLLSAS